MLIVPFSPAESDLNDYDVIAQETFWNELYTYGGWTLYCGYRFEHDRKTEKGKSVAIEHIYPTDKMIEQLDCSSRMQCRESGNNKFALMEADMHNMYPVWHALVTHRYGLLFGEVEGEEWHLEDCDIEWKAGVVEPRPVARGNIARALLYMYLQYAIPLKPETLEMLRVWNREDPPSNQEIDRNDKIESVQGRRNPFIDDPSRVDAILKRVER